MKKIDPRVESVFAHAAAMHQSGRMKNTIYVKEKEVYILNVDSSVLLRFILSASSAPFDQPLGFKADDYETSSLYEKDGKIIFEKEEGEWNIKKSCGTTELTPDHVADIFSNFPPIKTNRITLRSSITSLLDTKLSHVELSGQVHDSINIKQKNIYDGKLIDITRKKATGMGISEKDNITENFGPLAIRTNDLIALFSFNDQLTFSFGSGDKGYCRVTGRNFKMAGIIGLCRYDELGTIEKLKGERHGRQVKKSRRGKSRSHKPIKKRSVRKKR